MELTNKFAKAVFHDNNHEFRQETREEQLIAEGCKRLIENAIILWNYLYLSEKVDNTPEGKQREELFNQIRHSSMASWQHINMLGEYDYSDERVNNTTQFHLPKILALKVESKREEENYRLLCCTSVTVIASWDFFPICTVLPIIPTLSKRYW